MTKVRSIAKLHTQLYCALFIYYMSIQNGGDLSCYSNKIESVSLRKCPIHTYTYRQIYIAAKSCERICGADH